MVTKDKAMESLVEQGEAWMKPLLEFRNLLAETTRPDRKTRVPQLPSAHGQGVVRPWRHPGRRRRATASSSTCPARTGCATAASGWSGCSSSSATCARPRHDIELVTEQELHHIRREWLNDPNEPDWTDHLPAIYRRVFGKDLDWTHHDAGTFTTADEQILADLGVKHAVPPTLVRKLLDLELSMDGLARRRGMPDRIRGILTEEWQPLHVVLEQGERVRDGGYQDEINRLQEALSALDDGDDA